jgi:hypothetical protein
LEQLSLSCPTWPGINTKASMPQTQLCPITNTAQVLLHLMSGFRYGDSPDA